MKRFFCTKCQRVRRVRRLPINTSENLIAGNVISRVGTCDWHMSGERVYHAPKTTRIAKRVVIQTPVKVSSKRGR